MCKKLTVWATMFFIMVGVSGAYTLISGTNITTTSTATSWYFNVPVNVTQIWQNASHINATALYLNYSLLREGVINVTISNDYENITVSDGGNYSFYEVCVPIWTNATGAWENTTACNVTGYWDVIRYITQYDSAFCVGSTNTTYNQTNTTTCFYCWPLDSNLTLGQTFNITLSCCQYHNWSNGTFGGYLCANMENEQYEDNKMFFGVIVLLPMLLAFALLIISNNLTDEHTMFKIFLNLFSVPSFFLSVYLASTIAGEYLTAYATLGEALTLTVIITAGLFVLMIAYYAIWLTKMIFDMVAENKRRREEY